MALKRFKTLSEIYGGELRRWPTRMREDALELLERSAAARVLLHEARKLDDALAAASADRDAALRRQEAPHASLVRLRAGVATPIATPTIARAQRRRRRWATAAGILWPFALPLRWIGMATVGGSAVMAGLVVGAMYGTAPSSDSGLNLLLQPAPLHLMAD